VCRPTPPAMAMPMPVTRNVAAARGNPFVEIKIFVIKHITF
jgi:hypothetical protein